jgi:hypothetical protein
MRKAQLGLAALIAASLATAAYAASGEVAEADAARKKPLQRCDQLKDKAELECLQKARERIVEARKKREASGKGDQSKLAQKNEDKDAAKDAARKK